MPDPDLARLRRFMRAVTAASGALEASYLGRGRPLGPARVLFSLNEQGTEVRDLRKTLGLDSGLTSRYLRGLEAEGLIRTEAAEGDARRRRICPTDAGLAEIRAYDRLSDIRAADMLAGLAVKDQDSVMASLDRIATLLLRDQIALRTVAPDDPALGDCTRAYYAELSQRMGQPFTPAPDPDPEALVAPRGVCLIALSDGATLGCVSLRGDGPGRAEIKRLWLAPMARGLGLSRRLMRAAEDAARGLGITSLRLDTSRHLPEALELYRRDGWTAIARYNDNPYADYWFGKQL